MTDVSSVAGVLLAGGLSRRMGGGDKCLRMLGGRTILGRIVDRVRPQVSHLVLNANGDPARFSDYGLPVIEDTVSGYAGPLAGVLTGLEWVAREHPDCEWLASFPTDAPFLPEDLVARMLDAIAESDGDMACAASDGRSHPVVGLWPVRLAADLRQAMVEEEVRKVDVWTARYRLVTVGFGVDPIDPFFNTNRPDDLRAAQALIDRTGRS